MDLRRIWTAKTPGASEPDATERHPPLLRAALAELERTSRDRPALEGLAPTIAGLLEAAFRVPGTPVPSLSPGDAQTAFLLERIREGWNEGVPAVRVITPTLDRARLIHRARAINAVAGNGQPEARELLQRLDAEPDRVRDWICELLGAGEEAIGGPLERAGLEPAYALSVFRLALLGELGEWSMRISGHGSDSTWSRCGCPVCGAMPAVGESRGLEQQRFLRCLRCGAGWPGSRLQCARCGQTDHRALRYLFAEQDQARCRLVICDACGGRLKIMTTLAPLSPPGLIVAEFAMLHLDHIDEGSADIEGP